MNNAVIEIYRGIKSLFIGMRITLGQFFKPSVTLCYPHEALKMPARFRGHIELVRDQVTGKPKCFVCKLCEKACPSDCITVEGLKPDGAKRKTVTYYRLDFTKCSLCGSCVEACRDGAIRYSRDYNLASLSKEDFVMDLFKRLEAEAQPASVAASLPQPAEPPQPEPAKTGPPKAAVPAADGAKADFGPVQTPAISAPAPTALGAELK